MTGGGAFCGTISVVVLQADRGDVSAQWARVSDKVMYRLMRDVALLQRRRVRKVEFVGQPGCSRLRRRVPTGCGRSTSPERMWRDPGYWYAVPVIDHYSRYLLDCHLSGSHTARDVQQVLDLACEEAERVCGSLRRPPVLV